MGEARRRGAYDERRKTAIKTKKNLLLNLMRGEDEKSDSSLRAGIAPFLSQLSPDEWGKRRAAVIEALQEVDIGEKLAVAKSIRVQGDEIIWYLFLCQQALDDPMCNDVSQVARAAPFFSAIGSRWQYASSVKGLERKIHEILHDKRKEPDGLLFEVLVALAYAEAGWEVELLEEKPPQKSPDILIRMGEAEFYVECKRLARRTEYAENERNYFLERWDATKEILAQNGQWIWFKAVFHMELSLVPLDFLAKIFKQALPIGSKPSLIYDGPEATVSARLIDRKKVRDHLSLFRVKLNSSVVSQLLGGDWAPPNSSVTMIKMVKTSLLVDCEAPVLGTYIDDITWGCGITRDFDSEVSLSKKAKDVTKHLSDAVKQVPADRPSIIHIAAETMEGSEVELLRTDRVFATIKEFIMDKPVVAVRFHRFLANNTTDKLWEFDETVDKFEVEGFPNDAFPLNVVVPSSTLMQSGSHWKLYPST